jgi:hypothetical protein
MQNLCEVAYEANHTGGVRAVEAQLHRNENGFRNIDCTPSWRNMARFCQDPGGRLRGNEQDFPLYVERDIGWIMSRAGLCPVTR